MQDDVVALFAYDRWANTKVFDACRKLTAEGRAAGKKEYQDRRSKDAETRCRS